MDADLNNNTITISVADLSDKTCLIVPLDEIIRFLINRSGHLFPGLSDGCAVHVMCPVSACNDDASHVVLLNDIQDNHSPKCSPSISFTRDQMIFSAKLTSASAASLVRQTYIAQLIFSGIDVTHSSHSPQSACVSVCYGMLNDGRLVVLVVNNTSSDQVKWSAEVKAMNDIGITLSRLYSVQFSYLPSVVDFIQTECDRQQGLQQRTNRSCVMVIAMHGIDDTPFGSTFALGTGGSEDDTALIYEVVANVLVRCGCEYIVMNECVTVLRLDD